MTDLERRRATRKAWSRDNRDKVNASRRKYRNSGVKVRMAERMAQARARGRKTGMPSTATVEDLMPFPAKCPLLGIDLVYNATSISDASPSIDRIDPAKGYVPGNVWIISNRANRIKNDGTLAEIKLIAANLAAKIEGD